MKRPDILCLGAVLWDMIGRSTQVLARGSDVAGRLTRAPGGVAFNIASALARHGMRPAMLGVVGRDAEGDALIDACQAQGVNADHLLRAGDLPTDRYVAIEDARGLVAAIADARSLELAGERVLAPLADGRLGDKAVPWSGPICVDGNLTEALLHEIATAPLFRHSRLHVASAGPGKAARLRIFLEHPAVTFHVNREEAALICQNTFTDSAQAALGLTARGVARAVVTDGAAMAADALGDDVITALPRTVSVARITGAGDAFMAAHIATTSQGAPRDVALGAALAAAATHISAEDP